MEKKEYYRLSVKNTGDEFNTDLNKGLSSEEAAKRLETDNMVDALLGQ